MSEHVGSATRHRFAVATLEDLRRLPHPRVAPGLVEVDITLDGIEDDRRADLERRMARELAACGCREGSIAVLLYAAIVPMLAILGIVAPSSVLGWVAIVGGILVASMVGKVLGLALAQVRLRRVAREVEAAAAVRTEAVA